jgi:hypothetical protein
LLGGGEERHKDRVQPVKPGAQQHPVDQLSGSRRSSSSNRSEQRT